MTSILIVGAGAVGALFGSALARQEGPGFGGLSVGLRRWWRGKATTSPARCSATIGSIRTQVFREVAECKTPPDFLILTTKVLEGVDRAALIRPGRRAQDGHRADPERRGYRGGNGQRRSRRTRSSAAWPSSAWAAARPAW